MAVDDFGRAAYAELLLDGRKGTRAAFMVRRLGVFRWMGVAAKRVMTDNDPGYRSGGLKVLPKGCGIRHIYARSFSPSQNGRVERMNRTLAQEW